MNYETPYATITADNGLVAGILHVSPLFMRFGQPQRGSFAGRRLSRTRRTDARRQQRTPVSTETRTVVRSENVLEARFAHFGYLS